ncbi:MAG: heme exporter protein CcmB [Anaerolineae bacterium]
MLRVMSAILWKDVRIELRTKEIFSSSFLFALLVLVVFNFTLFLTPQEAIRLGPGFLWISFTFAGLLALNRSFALEKEENCTHGLLASPADKGALYLGKLLANTLFMLAVELVLLPLFAVFFNIPLGKHPLLLLATLFLGSVGFSSVGTVFSAMAAGTRMREVMLPVLLLPVSIPIVIAAVETTAYSLGSGPRPDFWIRLMVAYDVVFVTSSFLVFGFLLEE